MKTIQALLHDIERNVQTLRMKIRDGRPIDLEELDFRLYQIETDASQARMQENIKDG